MFNTYKLLGTFPACAAASPSLALPVTRQVGGPRGRKVPGSAVASEPALLPVGQTTQITTNGCEPDSVRVSVQSPTVSPRRANCAAAAGQQTAAPAEREKRGGRHWHSPSFTPRARSTEPTQTPRTGNDSELWPHASELARVRVRVKLEKRVMSRRYERSEAR